MPKASTAAERAAAVDKEMEAALAEMDDLLLKEKKVLAEKRSAAMSAPAETSGSSGAGAGGGLPTSGASGGQSAPAGGDPSQSGDSSGGGANTTGDSGNATTGEHNASGAPQDSDAEGETKKQRTPPDIPDGRDDDIVARQLREAAISEDDPALREKLWDEYRKYKSGQK